MPVVAASSPADCFDAALESWRIASKFMVPVVLLTDGYIANGSEPWKIPDFASLPEINIKHPESLAEGEEFMPYARDENLARPWAIPGTPELMHRVGGLEKQDGTGNVSYDPENHQHMVNLRQQKVLNIADEIPLQAIHGPDSGKVLVLSWGGTFGACRTAVNTLLAEEKAVSHAHLRYLNPLPKNLGEIVDRFDKVLVPELNMGQLNMIVRARYLTDTIAMNKVQGKPFSVYELVEKIQSLL